VTLGHTNTPLLDEARKDEHSSRVLGKIELAPLMSYVPACGKHTTPFAFGTQPCLTHQSGHPFAGDASSPIVQLGMQA
jgi:hypothetical protein